MRTTERAACRCNGKGVKWHGRDRAHARPCQPWTEAAAFVCAVENAGRVGCHTDGGGAHTRACKWNAGGAAQIHSQALRAQQKSIQDEWCGGARLRLWMACRRPKFLARMPWQGGRTTVKYAFKRVCCQGLEVRPEGSLLSNLVSFLALFCSSPGISACAAFGARNSAGTAARAARLLTDSVVALHATVRRPFVAMETLRASNIIISGGRKRRG